MADPQYSGTGVSPVTNQSTQDAINAFLNSPEGLRLTQIAGGGPFSTTDYVIPTAGQTVVTLGPHQVFYATPDFHGTVIVNDASDVLDFNNVSGVTVEGAGAANAALNNGPSDISFATQGGSTVDADADFGQDGNNTVHLSGTGNDTFTGGTHDSTVFGNGHSVLNGGTGHDVFFTSSSPSGHDTINLGAHTVAISNDPSEMHLFDGGDNYAQAGDSKDTIWGADGPGTIFGGGQTQINAGNGEKIGAQGSDSVWGGSGSDTIYNYDFTAGDKHLGAAGSYDNARIQALGTGHFEVHLDQLANDSVFGTAKNNVDLFLQQSSTDYTSKTLADGSTQINFTSGQQLDVQNVNIHFQGTDKTLKA